MLLPARRILSALEREFARLTAQLRDRDIDGSSSTSIANGLQLLLNRETGDAAAIHAQVGRLDQLLDTIGGQLEATSSLRSAVLNLRQSTARLRSTVQLSALEQEWRDLLARFQELMVSVIGATDLSPTARTTMARTVVAWEAEDLARQAATADQGQSPGTSVEVGVENLTAYLRDRFGEPALQVTSPTPLSGGFGKQTILFSVEGTALSGEFVMRRDLGEHPSVANDCHRIRHEYPVIRAAAAKGFPAPDALWLDTEHGLLPGGDFIVMRRSPGRPLGSFFGARSEVPPDLADALADTMARLHTLTGFEELGALTDSIRPELWTMPVRDCVERYIRNWYDLFLRERHTSSPALIGLYGWLLDNVPERDGRPVLLHGDMGFHNFLFDDGGLSAVLDWEFAHVGDPAEELGFVKVTVGAALDWDRLMSRYRARGGRHVDPATLHFFQVWAYVRNATAANLVSTLLSLGLANELKLALLPVAHIPHFIRSAQALIDSGVNMTGTPVPAHVPPALVRDFDYLDMRGETDVYAHFGQLHDGPDIFWTPRYGGHWVATRYADMEHILSTPGDFSSRHQTIPVNPVLVTLIESDGELHADFRRLVQPLFSPKSVGALEKVATELTATLIDGFYRRGECDFTGEFAQMMPIAIAMKLIGLPEEDRPYLLQIADDMVRSGDRHVQEEVFARVIAYFDTKIIPSRRSNPGSDMVSAIIQGRVEGGRPPTDEEVLGLCCLLIAGGLDTVTSMLGFIALFLARHPAHREQLIDDPALIPRALEELMRRHHIANVARVAVRDVEYNGVLFQAGDLVLTPTSAAGIDERRYPDPLTVDFNRDDRKTLVFGRGPHQCVGAFLARTELRVFLKEWLARIPHFEVKSGEQPITAPGKANGFRYLPLTWKVAGPQERI